jgi:spore maturation protein CgeB
MKISMFYHSLVSDWNHGNAHFLRGVASELCQRGHRVAVYEPTDGWSRTNLLEHHGSGPIDEFAEVYPMLRHASHFGPSDRELENAVGDSDLVIVHEWNRHELVAKIGELRRKHGFRLLFHDTHHRLVTAPAEMEAYDLSEYDGVLAFGDVLRDLYLTKNLAKRAWTWHEAADTRVFHPLQSQKLEGDLVWIGNWGDDERAEELRRFLIEPVAKLGLKACVYGVRYPEHAIAALQSAGIEYRGWLPNFKAPEVFSRFRMTIHVPRRPYVEALPGIPTIRPFEAMACGMPLISAPWNDVEKLFHEGRDYLVASSGEEMVETLDRLRKDKELRRTLTARGRTAICARHTCAHRVDELLAIVEQLHSDAPAAPALAPLI